MASNLDETNLGSRISLLFKITGDPSHPFSEAVGVLQRVERRGDKTTYSILRRSGEAVEVPDEAIVKFKLLG